MQLHPTLALWPLLLFTEQRKKVQAICNFSMPSNCSAGGGGVV